MVVALWACATSGCGSDGPTEPDPKPPSLSDLFGTQLLRSDGSPVGISALNDIPLIGIYFADPGCPACAGFTPVLVGAYDQFQQDGRSFEVVLVTFGISQSAMFDYMVNSGMGWLAVPPQGSRANALVQRYDVRWIPTLVIIDGAANTISLAGRDELTQSGLAAYDVWLAASTGN